MATKKKAWGDMSPDEREAAVRRLMNEGGSNTSVAQELGTTPGAIAGLRRRKGIPSTNDAPTMGKPEEETMSHEPQPPPPREARAAQEPPRKLKMAASEATQCTAPSEDGRPCAGEREPGSVYCFRHKHLELRRNPARR